MVTMEIYQEEHTFLLEQLTAGKLTRAEFEEKKYNLRKEYKNIEK